jgi:basic membrane protein A and related proteins
MLRIQDVRVLSAAIVLAASLGLIGGDDAPAAAGRPNVVLLLSAPCDRGNFLCPTFERALRRTGTRGRIVSPDPREDRVSSVALLVRQGYDLVVVDPGWLDTLGTAARRFPKVRFVVVDPPPGGPNRSNVQRVTIRPQEAAFLAGWLAGKLERRRPGADVVGIVAGARIPPVEDFVVGFRAGARHAAPGITVLTGYSQDFADPRKCEAIARRQIARGAGAVFNVAGSCGLGTLAAARTGRIWGIGVDVDQAFLGPHILTSVVKHYDVAFSKVMRARNDGTRRLTLGLLDGAASLGRISPKAPAALRSELDDVRRRIVRGQIRVPGAP